MKCPRDASTLHNAQMEAQFSAAECHECGGLWLTRETLDGLISRHAHDAVSPESGSEEVAAAFEMARQESAAEALCPVCEQPLSRHEYGFASQIMVDACSEGHGLWLDQGELERLERFFARERASSAETGLSRLWARLAAAFTWER